MTFTQEFADEAQEVRWRRWQAKYARTSRRSATQVTIVMVAVGLGIAAFLLVQLVGAARVV